MNTIAKVARLSSTALTSPIDGGDVLAVLDRRLSELQSRRDAITKQIIIAEKTSPAEIGINAASAQAEALLDGGRFAAREKPISPLAALHDERNTIDLALKIGRSRQHRLATERAGEIWASHFAEIAEIEKRRVMLALELQRVNRARETLRERLTRAGGAGYLPTDGADFLGLGDIAEGDVFWGCERLIADGIATASEIKKARSDG
jgi:hypothetical protein